MTPDRYNGWANYPTWCVALWLRNNEDSEQCLREIAAAAADRYDAGADVEAWVMEDVLGPTIAAKMDGARGMVPDLLQWCSGLVDWCEIADAVLEEPKEVTP